MKKLNLAVLFGTRPEAIKMAPVILEMKKHHEYIDPCIIVTAQHREMLDQVLDLFSIRADFDLNIMSERQTLFDVNCRVLYGLQDVFQKARPDMVLVHGDTTTTFAGALAAYYSNIPVGHVEAGLRTGDKYAPFPEEVNRHLTGVLADYHFAPTNTSRDNLLKENVKADDIFVTGNTVIDALQETVKKDYSFADDMIRKCIDSGRKIILLTTHRRENLGKPLRQVYRALAKIMKEHDDVEVIFPVHKNPAVRDIVNQELGDIERINLVEPLDYEPFANLMARSYMVLTDSGGLQEEAPSLGKPVLVLRNTTERPEAVLAGTVKLTGTEFESVYKDTKELLENGKVYKSMSEAVNPYGDGFAAKRIIGTLLHKKGFSQTLPECFCIKDKNTI